MKHKSIFALSLIIVSMECVGFAQSPLLHANSILDSLQSITASTIPANGEVNPYGIAFVPAGFPNGGKTSAGNLLVSNFNGTSGLQGTGTTIVSLSPTGQQTLFATSTLIGLDTALGALSKGFVVAGNLPVAYPGGVATPGQGSLQIFDRNGNVVSTLNDSATLDSPWDLTIHDQGSTAQIYVSNVLSGTVTRVNVSITSTQVTVVSKTQIGSGYAHMPNDAAVVVGPTGLAYDASKDILYVASTADNKIYGISSASSATSASGPGFVVFSDQKHLHGPLGLVLGSNGNLITANGDAVNAGGTPNDLVEFTQQGFLVATYQLDAGAPGGAFGIAITAPAATVAANPVRFAAVDDDLNTATIWTLSSF